MLKENQAFENAERNSPRDGIESEKAGLWGMKPIENGANAAVNPYSVEAGFQKRRQEVEAILTAFLPEEKGPAKTGIEAMNYSLMVGGKRIRPILLREAFLLFAGEERQKLFLPLAEAFMLAMEMIHSFSLCHDDLPAMDNDKYRRGKEATWYRFTEAQGILAGDSLSLYAFQWVLEVLEREGKNGDSVELLSPTMQGLKILAKSAGIEGMIGGQVLDIEKTGQPLTEEELFFIYKKKTAALLSASLEIGALLGGANSEEQEKLASFGEKIGLAFQIRDDILDEISSFSELGKPIHSDAEQEKTTALSLYGMEKAEAMVEQYTEEGRSLLQSLDRNAVDGEALDFLLSFSQYLCSRRS
jgi:possible farnesyltranstransferase (fragment)